MGPVAITSEDKEITQVVPEGIQDLNWKDSLRILF